MAGEKEKAAPASRLFPTPALSFFFFIACLFFSLRDFAGNAMASLSSLFLQNARGFDTRHAGIAVSVLSVGGILGNPLLSSLSDGRRKRWITVVLAAGSSIIILFPRVPSNWTLPCLLAFGFFFLASFPTIEAALMQSVPDAVRGRVFGFYVMITGFVGALAPWVMGLRVKQMAGAARDGHNYFWLYAVVGAVGLLALAGLPCLHAIRKREHIEEKSPEPHIPSSGFK